MVQHISTIRRLACCAFVALAAFAVTAEASAKAKKKAHHPPPPAAQGEPVSMVGMVAAHNRAREAVGVPDLQWSAPLAQTAQGWADHLRGEHCAMRHSGTQGIGENLAWAGGQHLSASQVVGMWVDERHAFNLASNECASGAVCGHYTQVVWKNTKLVGCGIASCGNSEIWVCNYSPPGNYIGERPY